MEIAEFKATLPTLPAGYEWDIRTYMVDDFKFGWHIRLFKVIPGGWFGLFDKRETYRGNALVTYTPELPEKEMRAWVLFIMSLDNLWVDKNKEA